MGGLFVTRSHWVRSGQGVPGDGQSPGGHRQRACLGWPPGAKSGKLGRSFWLERKNPARRIQLGGGSSRSGCTKCMPIITDFGPAVQDYRAHFESSAFPRPAECPCCGAAHTFIGHGFYLRKPKDQTQVYRIWLKRWFCKACHTTLSVLPSFLLRFRHYLLGVIQQVVVARFEDHASWQATARQCAPEGLPAPRTIGRWCHAFAAQAARWWAAVQATLAQQDSAAPALDPLGPAAGPSTHPALCSMPPRICWPGPRPAGRKWSATAAKIACASSGTGAGAAAWHGWSNPHSLRTGQRGAGPVCS